MRTTLIWSGIAYQSLEHCQVDVEGERISIDSVIIGSHEGRPYRIGYMLTLNKLWEVRLCAIKSIIGHNDTTLVLEKKGGDWYLDGQLRTDFENCTDIDLSLTPLTNSLPINRLGLHKGEAAEIDVVYFDLLSGAIKPVKQQYTRLTADAYRYENVPNDFEAEIKVDAKGFVVAYPRLFVRS